MNVFGSWCARTAAAVALVVGLGSPAAALDIYTVSGSLASTAANPENSVRNLSGNIFPFGDVTGQLTFAGPIGADGRFSATFVLENESGKVTGTISGQAVPPLGPTATSIQYLEVITVTGGTGEFTGIRGVILLTGTVSTVTGVGQDTVAGGVVIIP